MIDWLTIVLPYSGPDVSGGRFLVCDADGCVEKETMRPLYVEGGSWSEKTSLKIIPAGLRIDGNPSKWLQGHNLVGSDDLHALVCAWVPQVLSVAGCADFSLLRDVQRRNYVINRVDCTYMFTLPEGVSPAAWIEAAKLQATGKYQKSEGKGTTLYIGKNSTYSTCKIYSKYDEIKKRPLKIPHDLIETATNWLKDKIRIEVTYRKPALKKMGIHKMGLVSPYIFGLFQAKMRSVNIMGNVMMQDDELMFLPSRYKAVYQLWTMGHNILDLYSRRTAFRHAKFFRETYGINILQPRGNIVVQEIPLVKIMASYPARCPSWLEKITWSEAA